MENVSSDLIRTVKCWQTPHWKKIYWKSNKFYKSGNFDKCFCIPSAIIFFFYRTYCFHRSPIIELTPLHANIGSAQRKNKLRFIELWMCQSMSFSGLLSIRSNRKYFNLRPFAAHHQNSVRKESLLRPPHVIWRNTINLERQNHSVPQT